MTHMGFSLYLSVLLFYGKIKYQHTYAFRTLTFLKFYSSMRLLVEELSYYNGRFLLIDLQNGGILVAIC